MSASMRNTGPERLSIGGVMSSASPLIHVACAVIVGTDGRILLSLRPDHVHQGGLWEFPGGKIEAGEEVRSALDRELAEELGIVVRGARPLIRIRHDYPDRSVLLDVWRVDVFEGEPHGREGQRLEWVASEALPERAMPAADVPIVNAVRLPATYLITGEPDAGPQGFLAQLDAALARGVRLVQLRAKTLSDEAYLALAYEVVQMCHRVGAQVLLNGDPAWVEATGADGVHLNGARLQDLSQRPVNSPRHWVAASVHDLAQLRQAEALGVDFVVVSPVLPTASHSGAQTLGWHGLRALTEAALVPVYALGGLSPADLDAAWAHGAQGIAAIRALWENGPQC